MEFGQVRQRRLSDDIVAQLEAMILEGTLKSGERLPAERVLAEQFGVSRPSLREAIQKLVAKGLLVSRQGGGNYVTESLGATFSDPLLHLLEGNPEAQRDLLEFRHTLEGSCAYYAALRATSLDHQRLTEAFEALQACYARNDQVSAEEGAADARFHLAIAEASHNTVLLHTIHQGPVRLVAAQRGDQYRRDVRAAHGNPRATDGAAPAPIRRDHQRSGGAGPGGVQPAHPLCAGGPGGGPGRGAQDEALAAPSQRAGRLARRGQGRAQSSLPWRMARWISRSESRSFSVWRLSKSFLPLARAISHLTRCFFQYIDRATQA